MRKHFSSITIYTIISFFEIARFASKGCLFSASLTRFEKLVIEIAYSLTAVINSQGRPMCFSALLDSRRILLIIRKDCPHHTEGFPHHTKESPHYTEGSSLSFKGFTLPFRRIPLNIQRNRLFIQKDTPHHAEGFSTS